VQKRILAVSSGGGHWVQLLRLRPALDGHEVAYVSVQLDYAEQVPGARFYCVRDATRWSRWDLVKMIAQVTWVLIRERPDVVISTGAAPGVVALWFGKLIGAKTIWLDSIANVESVSMSGEKIGKAADMWLTQWKHLARDDGPSYFGSVM